MPSNGKVSFYDLTLAEIRVVRLLAKGHSNKEIGKKLRISDKTVKNHLSHIYKRTRTRSRVALIAKFFEITPRY